MRILSIGATGFIGKPTLERLIQLGHEIIAFHRGDRQPPTGMAAEIHGDYRRISEYRSKFQSQAPDVVLHMTIANERQAADFVNTFRGFARRAVVLSSADVYRAAGILHGTELGEPDNAPITEDAPLRTQPHPYPPEAIQMLQKLFPWAEPDYDKIPAEGMLMGDSELPGTVLRLPMVYGPRDPLHRLWPVVKRVANGRSVIPIAESIARWRGPREYVENVAAAITRAVIDERATGRIYNVAEPDNFSELEWTRRIADVAGFQGRDSGSAGRSCTRAPEAARHLSSALGRRFEPHPPRARIRRAGVISRGAARDNQMGSRQSAGCFGLEVRL